MYWYVIRRLWCQSIQLLMENVIEVKFRQKSEQHQVHHQSGNKYLFIGKGRMLKVLYGSLEIKRSNDSN